MPNNYIQWPLNPNQDDIFTSEYGKTWVFDGCGWVATCCPPVVPCDPEVNGISVIYTNIKNGLINGYGVSYFTWNSNFNRYEGVIDFAPIVITWTGSQWKFITPDNGNIITTSSTSNILEATWSTVSAWNTKHTVVQIECGLIYNQLCVETTYYSALPNGASPRGPFTLYPDDYPSIADIIDGVQATRYGGIDSNGTSISIYYDSFDSVWYMDDNYGNSWTISAAPNQNALILGSEWISPNNGTGATFSQGVCDTECYPERDGITVMYNDGKWNPIYLTWDAGNGQYYTDNQYINELWGWNWIAIQYDSGNDILKIVVDSGSGPNSIAGNNYNGNFATVLFNHTWDSNFDIYCGDVGCTRMCATFNGSSTTMAPFGYDSIESAIACNSKFSGWVGWNGSDEVIYLNWNDGTSEYKIDIDGNGLQLIPVTSHTTAALVAASPYSYSQGSVSGTLTLTSGDCP
ncbi:MAG: hypothetical protein ACOVOV_00705 [Dolichospermum sp.]